MPSPHTTLPTLSLAQVARLAEVQRPVVTMWRKRPVPDAEFPSPLPDGRYETEQVLTYLERSGRGNNPHARVDLAMHSVLSRDTPTDDIAQLMALVAARSLVGQPLADLRADDLLDVVEEADGDDDWLWSEISRVDLDRLPAIADDLVEAAWTPADAHDRLLAELERRQSRAPALAPALVTLLADLVRASVAPESQLVDVAGTATDVLLELLRDEDLPELDVQLPATGEATRRARQRYEVRGIHPQCPEADEWDLPPGGVAVVRLPDDPGAAVDQLFDVQSAMAPGATALAIGPEAALVGPAAEGDDGRARLLAMEGIVRAIVRLPQGLLEQGAHEYPGLWVLGAPDPKQQAVAKTGARAGSTRPGSRTSSQAAEVVRVADLSGIPFTATTRQQLLDDLLAASRLDQRRAFRLLHRVSRSTLASQAGSLVAGAGSGRAELTPSATSDVNAARELLAKLDQPLTNPLHGLAPRATDGGEPLFRRLGELADSPHVIVRSGSRPTDWDDLHAGPTRVWTADAVAARTPRLLTLPQGSAPRLTRHRTRPDDVVFNPTGTPAAVVDATGGAYIASPARILRIHPDADLSPRAVAATINELGPSSGAWRTWRMPLARRRRAGEDALKTLDDYEKQLRDRLSLVDDLRRVLVRSLLRGTVALTPGSPADTNSKGH